MHGSIIPLALVAGGRGRRIARGIGGGRPSVPRRRRNGRGVRRRIGTDRLGRHDASRARYDGGGRLGDRRPHVTHAGDYDIAVTCSLAAIVTLHTPAHVTPAPTPTPSPSPSPTVVAPVPTTPPAPALQVAFTAPPSGAPRSAVTLDAGGSTGAVAYEWDVGANGTVDASCLGGQPQLTTRLPSSGALDLALTAIDASGSRSTVRHTISVSGGRSAHASAVAGGQRVFICGAGAGQHPGDLTAQGGPPADCTTSVQFGLVDAIGCLRPLTDMGQVPAAERQMLLNHQRSTAFPSSVGGSHALHVDDQIAHETVRLNGIDIERDQAPWCCCSRPRIACSPPTP